MNPPRIVTHPAFTIIGKKTWISGQENTQFGDFWAKCESEGLFEDFNRITASKPGPCTNGVTLGVSLVADDPANRSFFYMIAAEKPENTPDSAIADLETYNVPATKWAIFSSRGQLPDSLVAAEIYAFSEWLPTSGYVHAHAPEMEVYPPNDGNSEGVYCEFWLPIIEA